jgi:glucokinase
VDKNNYSVGIDIGGTNIKVAAVAADGRILSRQSMPTGTGREYWSSGLRESLSAFENELDAPARGICLAAPGLPARDRQTILWMRGRLEELQGLNWRDLLNYSVPVPVINDAQAAVLGEAWIGAAAGLDNVLMFTLGTGVGGGAVVDGRVLRGALGRAGHLGHITVDFEGATDIVGTPGSLEDAIGECTLLLRSGGLYSSTRDLVDAYIRGNKDASAIWMRSIRCLAAGIASLINVLDPEVIVVGGGIAAAGSALFEPLSNELDRIEWRPTDRPVAIVPAQLGEWAGAVGAGKLALQEIGDID